MQRCKMWEGKIKKISLILLPIVLMGTLWGVNWHRLHPPATAEELAIEALLAQADHLNVTGFISFGAGSWISAGEYKKSDFQSLIQGFRLDHSRATLKLGELPNVYFVFSKGTRQLVSCQMRNYNGYAALNYYATQPPHTDLSEPLDEVTMQHFRTFIQTHPQLQKNIDGNMFLH